MSIGILLSTLVLLLQELLIISLAAGNNGKFQRSQPRSEILECRHSVYSELHLTINRPRAEFHFINTELRTERPHMRGARVYLVPELRPSPESLSYHALQMVKHQKRWLADYADYDPPVCQTADDSHSSSSSAAPELAADSKGNSKAASGRFRWPSWMPFLGRRCRHRGQRFDFNQWFTEDEPLLFRQQSDRKSLPYPKYARRGPWHAAGRWIARHWHGKQLMQGGREYTRRAVDLEAGPFMFPVADFQRDTDNARWITGYTLDLSAFRQQFMSGFAYRAYIVRGGWSGLHALLGTSQETVRFIDKDQEQRRENLYKTGVDVRDEENGLIVDIKVPKTGLHLSTKRQASENNQEMTEISILFTDWKLRIRFQRQSLPSTEKCNDDSNERLELRVMIQPMTCREDDPDCYPTLANPVQPFFYRSSMISKFFESTCIDYIFDADFPATVEELRTEEEARKGEADKELRIIRLKFSKTRGLSRQGSSSYDSTRWTGDSGDDGLDEGESANPSLRQSKSAGRLKKSVADFVGMLKGGR